VKRLPILITALLAVAVVFAPTGSADHPGSQTLTFVERNNQGTFRFVDLPPRSRSQGEPTVSAGDVVVGSNRLYDESNERRVGRFFFQCRAIVRRARFERVPFLCTGAFKLPRGTITLEAVVLFAEDTIRGAVTGGTGAYEGASGGVTFDDRRRTSVDTIHFDTD
jgi:allene oxide cyclase-like protein